MSRKNVILVFAIAAAAVAGVLALSLTRGRKPAQDASAPGPPNIVLIIIDTLRADLLGCYGFAEDISPELDEIARNGVLLEKTVAQCSWTRPSIGSMITSLYPRTLGLYKEMFDILPDRHLTLAEVLRAEGYKTVGITANPNINRVFNFHQGFDEYAESNVIWKWMKDEEGKRIHKKDHNANLPSCTEVFEWVLGRAKDKQGKPTYVQINVMEVHSPYLVRREYATMYRGRPVRKHIDYSDREVKACVWGTYAAVSQVSHDTALFIERLRSTPGWENTLFVITSDHGQGLDNHPDVELSMLHGNILYESQLLVPLIFYNPADPERVAAGRRVTQKVRLIDIMPTLLEYAEMPIPDRVIGRSLLPLLAGAGSPPYLPDLFFAETSFRRADKVAVYSDGWRYIENRDGWGGVNELELQRAGAVENGVLTDRVDIHPDEAARLRAALQRWEERFPRVPSVQPGEGPSEEELEQLKSLGYIE